METERGVFAEEYHVWHTPAIGAYLFWRFATIFIDKSRNGKLPTCVHFFLLAGVMREVKIVKDYIPRKRSLLAITKAIKENGDADLIDGIHERVRSLMEYTSFALDIAVAAGMLEWDFDTASLRPLKVASVPGSGAYRDSSYFNGQVTVAETLGKLFAAVPTESDIATLLKVRL